MGREVRRVAPDWQHPMEDGRYQPLRKLDMPVWRNGRATHLQMYETHSHGTPLSPVMDNPERLARWLVNNQVPAFAGKTTSYEAWLMICQGRTVIVGTQSRNALMDNVYENRLSKKTNAVVDPFDEIENDKHRPRAPIRER